ncbi:hypothetical protein QUF70_13500 [Desulfobacterales bacterium HSG17]|nr:hypothetical protein [Desulfobacterales bacterium HSG17]
MDKDMDYKFLNDIKESLVSTAIHLETLFQLLIDKGIIDKDEYYTQLINTRDAYKYILKKDLSPADSRTRLMRLDDLSQQKRNEFLSTKILGKDEISQKGILQGSILKEITKIHRLARTMISEENDKVLPCRIKLIENQMVCDDPESAKKICASCIAQNMALLSSLGVRDVCILPQMMIKIKKPGLDFLDGINKHCWMFVIAERFMNAVKDESISRKNIHEQIIKAAISVDLALDQEISAHGIISIIDCAVLEANPDEEVLLESNISETENNDNDNDGDDIIEDINWHH